MRLQRRVVLLGAGHIDRETKPGDQLPHDQSEGTPEGASEQFMRAFLPLLRLRLVHVLALDGLLVIEPSVEPKDLVKGNVAAGHFA